MADNVAFIHNAQRSADPKPVRRKRPHAKLSRPEKAALRDLGRYMILSPQLFARTSGYGRTASYDGLHDLFEKGLADRGYYCEEPTEEELANSQPRNPQELAYKLTADGHRRGVRDGVFPDTTAILAKQWRGDAPDDMRHRLLIVDLMIEIRTEIARQVRLQISRLTPDFARRRNSSVNRDTISKDRFITADLVLGLEEFSGVPRALCFCEIEQTKLQPKSSCTSRTTIATKLRPYSEYLTSSHREITGAEQDLLLYVQNQPAEHLDEVIGDIPWDEVGAVRNVVRLTTFEDVRSHGVLSGRWRDWRGNLVRLAD